MVDRFRQFIEENQLFSKENHILVGVSGGVDSIVLCDLLHQLNHDFRLVHCNFQLRGANSDGDEAFVKEVAQGYEKPFLVKRFDTKAVHQKSKESIQMVARNLRYAWFEELLKEENHVFFTAHHLDDSLETFLLNVSRGTGIHGLQGISPVRGAYRRPLLFATKEEIRRYAKERDLLWRDDESNEKDHYDRNFLRHHVIPLLKENNPGVYGTFARTIKRLKGTALIQKDALNNFKKEHVRGDDPMHVNIEGLAKASSPLVLLLELLEPMGFTFDVCEQILERMEGHSGAIYHSESHEVLVDRSDLIVSSRGPFGAIVECIEFNEGTKPTPYGKLMLEKVEVADFSLDASHAFLAMDKLTFPLELRSWKEGDRFQPLGMQGKKKLSDFMIDLKIPLNLKEKVLVLTSEEEIVWVVGYRIDDRFKISDSTNEILHLSWV